MCSLRFIQWTVKNKITGQMYIFIIHLLTDDALNFNLNSGNFHLFVVLKKGTFLSSGQPPELNCCHSGFCSGCTISHSRQQPSKGSKSPMSAGGCEQRRDRMGIAFKEIAPAAGWGLTGEGEGGG